MSYFSGFMLGAAIGKRIHQFVSGGRTQSPLHQMTRRVHQAGVQVQRCGARAVEQAEAAWQSTAGLTCVSTLPGRRRYRAAMSPRQAALLRGKLAELSFLHTVEVNAQTGSLLFTFAPQDAAQMDFVADFLRDSIFSAAWRRRCLATAVPLETHAGELTRSVRRSVRDFSAWLKQVTGGWLDVSSAAFLIFLLRGLRKMILTQQYPSGSQMLWWAVSLMRGWRTV